MQTAAIVPVILLTLTTTPAFAREPRPLPWNRDATAWGDVDEAVGIDGKPPALELHFVTPQAIRRGLSTSSHPFGHAYLRYMAPGADGRPVLKIAEINSSVSGFGRDANLVTFLDPARTVYGDDARQPKRTFFSVRLEHVSPDQLRALDDFLVALEQEHRLGRAKGSLAPPIRNAVAKTMWGAHAEGGDCAWWTSRALMAAGLLTSPTMWPKKLFVQFLEENVTKDASNVHVVAYPQAPGATGKGANRGIETHGLHSLHPWNAWRHRNLANLAHVIVQPGVPGERPLVVRRPVSLRLTPSGIRAVPSVHKDR